MTNQIYKITDFLDRLEEQEQEIVPNSLKWVQHPTKPGLKIIAVQVQQKQDRTE